MDNQEVQLVKLQTRMDYLEKQIELEKQLIRSEVLNPMLAELKLMREQTQTEVKLIETKLNSLERLVWVLFGAVVSVIIRNFF